MLPESVRITCLISIVVGILPWIVGRLLGWNRGQPDSWRRIWDGWQWWSRPAAWLLGLLAFAGIVVAVFDLPLGGAR